MYAVSSLQLPWCFKPSIKSSAPSEVYPSYIQITRYTYSHGIEHIHGDKNMPEELITNVIGLVLGKSRGYFTFQSYPTTY